MRYPLGVLGWLAIASAQTCLATGSDLAFSRSARTYELQHSSLAMKAMANSCLALSLVPDSLPCNPALTPKNSKPSLSIEGQLSNGYASIENVRKLMDDKVTQEFVDNLFTQGKVIQVDAGVDLNFSSKFLNGQYIPLSIKSFSVARNEANPDIDLYALQESGFRFQTGVDMGAGLSLGLQVRTLQRKFIKQRFKLLSLATPTGKDLLKPKDQSVIYFEPGVSYGFQSEWRPRLSAILVNLGTVSKKYDELDEPSELQFGFAVSPPIAWGDIDLSIDYKSLSYEESDLQKFRFGALYRFGSMNLMLGLDAYGSSFGVYYDLDNINAGVVYSTTQTGQQGESFYTQTVYVQLGWRI